MCEKNLEVRKQIRAQVGAAQAPVSAIHAEAA
jgi:hypothetical protein